MLKNIDPILSADLLHTLRAMGHGDELVICDANFPGASTAAETVLGAPIDMTGVDSTTRVARAVLSVFPLDGFVDQPAFRMEVIDQPQEILEVHREFQAEIDHAAGRNWPMGSIERFAFYERAKRAYAVVTTGERRGYGCFILIKGVIGPDGEVVEP